mmetsp:Transcript_2385/g.4863  ORF Transcript_2385/g.4863 Transcript_2385/m.4863 type:complete len:233 (+) Transcript_2385:212-910(+)
MQPFYLEPHRLPLPLLLEGLAKRPDALAVDVAVALAEAGGGAVLHCVLAVGEVELHVVHKPEEGALVGGVDVVVGHLDHLRGELVARLSAGHHRLLNLLHGLSLALLAIGPGRHKVGLVVRLLGSRDAVRGLGAETERAEVTVVLQPKRLGGLAREVEDGGQEQPGHAVEDHLPAAVGAGRTLGLLSLAANRNSARGARAGHLARGSGLHAGTPDNRLRAQSGSHFSRGNGR